MPTSKKRRAFEEGHTRKFLVIVDDTPEVESAVFFAASRIGHTGGKLTMLYVIEPMAFQHWAGVRDVQIEEETTKAKALFRLFRRKLNEQGFEAVETEDFFVLLAKEKKLWAKTNKMCSLKSARHRYKYQICLRKEYVQLDKQTQKLTDKMLGVVGRHRAFGRRKIIGLSNAILKSQSRWKKFIVWDCEWPGHLYGNKPIAASSMTECRIKRAFIRRRSLDLDLKILNTLIEQKSKKDQ